MLVLASLNIDGLLIYFPLHDFIGGLAVMEPDQVTGSTELRIRIKAIAHSLMPHVP